MPGARFTCWYVQSSGRKSLLVRSNLKLKWGSLCSRFTHHGGEKLTTAAMSVRSAPEAGDSKDARRCGQGRPPHKVCLRTQAQAVGGEASSAPSRVQVGFPKVLLSTSTHNVHQPHDVTCSSIDVRGQQLLATIARWLRQSSHLLTYLVNPWAWALPS